MAFSDSFTLDEEAVSHCESSIDGIGDGSGEIGARDNANLRSTSIEFAVCVVQKLLFPHPSPHSLPTPLFNPHLSSSVGWLLRCWAERAPVLREGEEEAVVRC